MTLNLQIVIIVICLLMLLYIMYLIKRGRLQLRYSLLWFVLALLLLIFAIFPQPLFNLAHVFGFVSASNAIYFAGVLFLGVMALFLCSVVSQQSEKLKDMAQKIAMLEHEIDELKKK